MSRGVPSSEGRGFAGFAALSAAALQLPFFEVSGAQQDPALCKATDLSASDKKLIISNWPAYIDPKKKETSTLQVFQQQTGITVEYTDDVNDNAEFFAKVRNQMAACEPIGRDMMMLTDWMAARMIGLGWIQPLDADRVPNLTKNLIKPLRDRQWDPDLTYHAPWQSGLTGIAYNAAETGEVGLLRGAAHPRGPQGQDHPALRDARHDGLHAQDRGGRPRRLHRPWSGSGPSTGSARSWPPARSAPSPATSTSRT